MILEIDDWHLGYDQMVKDTRGSSVWILCNADVDSLAAARILTYMLRADSVSYQLRPCWSYTQLISVLQEPEATDRKALVLLNLGANRNLTRLFEYLTADTKVYVMDCRKPVHLANVHAGPNVVVFWDNGQDQIPSDGDNLSGNESTTDEEQSSLSEQESDDEDDSDDDQDPDEGEAEFDDEDDLVKRKEKAVEQEDPDYYGEDEDDDDDNEDEDEGTKKRIADTDDLTSSKRRKKDGPDDDDQDTDGEEASPEKDVPLEQQQPTMTPRELHRDRRNRLRAYYSEGSYYGSPVAWVAYRLATQKRWPDQGDLLWLACVGLTDAYIHGRIDKAGYVELSVDLKTQCLRVFPNDMIDRIDKTIYAESLRNQTGGSQTQVTISESGKVLAESDYRFFLLRHSSLYDSMMYSNYVATRLQVWTNAGKQRLDELLAKMGFPLDECKQPYAFMNPHLKRKLRAKLDEFAEQYGLDKLEFTSFQRVTGFKSLLSASDTSYAVTALLESEGVSQYDSFHVALEALNAKAMPLGEGSAASNLVNGGNLTSGIGAGISKAKLLQRKIVDTAMNLVERKAITRLRHFRYAFICCTSQESKDSFLSQQQNGSSENAKEYHVFAQPLALSRLAQWLFDMHRENGKWTGSKNRPLVLCAEKPETKSYLVVGYEFPEQQGQFLKNHFGQHFQMTCDSMQGTFRLDSFDSNVVEVDANDVQRFIEQLHYLMDSM